MRRFRRWNLQLIPWSSPDPILDAPPAACAQRFWLQPRFADAGVPHSSSTRRWTLPIPWFWPDPRQAQGCILPRPLLRVCIALGLFFFANLLPGADPSQELWC